MKEFSVCYDRFCVGRYAFACDEGGQVIPFEKLGAFEMYLLGMWSDGMVVSMKGYDEVKEENYFILLLPDGSEQKMAYSRKHGFVVEPFRQPGEGRFAYLLEFLQGLSYKGYQGYEEYDEEEGMIWGTVVIGEEKLMYGGHCMEEVKKDFVKVVEKKEKG